MPITLDPSGPNTVTVGSFDRLTGGAYDDDVTVTAGLADAIVELGAGNDVLRLASAANLVTVSGAESIYGGGAADTLTLLTPLTGGRIDLRGGNDIVRLSDWNRPRDGVSCMNTASVFGMSMRTRPSEFPAPGSWRSV